LEQTSSATSFHQTTHQQTFFCSFTPTTKDIRSRQLVAGRVRFRAEVCTGLAINAKLQAKCATCNERLPLAVNYGASLNLPNLLQLLSTSALTRLNPEACNQFKANVCVAEYKEKHHGRRPEKAFFFCP
jgi:hypothetical protein